jgi:hypothetical protein
MQRPIQIACDASRTQLLIATLANNAAAVKSIEITSKTIRANLLKARVADTTPRWPSQVFKHVNKEARSAARTCLGIAPLADTASTPESIEQACKAHRPKLAVSLFTSGTPPNSFIQKASYTMSADLLEGLLTVTTARTFEQVVDQA